jgi:hypothetical protein
MKILITNHQLKERGGSELFALEIGLALQARGHEVCLFSTLAGTISTAAEAAGLAFVQDPAMCPFQPDVIHGQHHLETMAALTRWPGVPGIYFLHGATPWEEHPPKHPRLRKYLGTSPRFGWWIARECGVAAEDVGTVRNFFDPAKFSQVRPADLRSNRAAVFHNTMDPDGKPFAAIRQACEAQGLKLDGIGSRFGKLTNQPEIDLLEYDVIFAGGRSGIEAMACGCTVIPVTKEQAAQRIHSGNYPEMADRNFTAETNDPPLSVEQILTELRAIDLNETAAVTARIRSEATLDRAVEALLEQYAFVVEAQREAGPSTLETAAAESAEVAAYLVSLAQRIKEVDDKRWRLVEQKETAVARAEKWQHAAARETKRLQHIQAALEGGSWWHRRLWRRLRRENE